MSQEKPIVLISNADLNTSTAWASLADDTVASYRAIDWSTNVSTTVTAADVPFVFLEKITNGTSYNDRITPPIYGGDILKVWSKEYAAPVAQVTYVGFNPVTNVGTLEFNCDADYGLKVIAYSPYIWKFYNSRGLEFAPVIHTECCADCDAGCGAVTDVLTEANKFVVAFNDHMNLNKFVGFEIVADNIIADTVAVFTDSSTMTFTQGSPFVTTSAATTLAVDDYIRVSGTATAVPVDTDPIYKIKTIISSTRFEMYTPWQNATVTRTLDTTLGDSDVSLVTKATITQVGIKATGKFYSLDAGCCCFPPFPFDWEGSTFSFADTWDSSFPCGALVWTTTTTYSPGHGTYKQVLFDEMAFLGHNGDVREFFHDCAANTNYSLIKEADSTKVYNSWYVKFRNSVGAARSGGDRSTVDYILKVHIDTGIAVTVMDTMWTSIAALAGITYENNA